jgi:hypothetical protein
MHPNHAGIIDFIMQTCMDGVNGLCAEMVQQMVEIAEEVRQVVQEEENKHHEQEMKQEELQRLNVRITILQGETAAQSVVVDDASKDKIKLVESAPDSKQMEHRPVSFCVKYIESTHL